MENRLIAGLRGDRVIWMIIALLSMASILAIYSATGTLAYKEHNGNTEFFLFKHIFILGIGLIFTYICYLMHYSKYSRIAPVLLLISIRLLLFAIAYGAETNQARRWIPIPIIDLTFQPSDFAKIALIIYVARAISAKQDIIKDFNSAFLPIIVPILIICGLIAPANLSTAILLFTTCIAMMFVGRVSAKYIILLLFCGIVVFAILIMMGQFFPDIVRVNTWISRVRDFMENTEGGYQTQQSQIAIAQGGWLGVGPGNSTQRNYLPSPYADFIYSIICEEYGLVGGFIILGLYILLFFRCVGIITRSPKAFGAMLVLGLGLLLTFQALINIAVSVHLVPVTGLNLPIVSMGGTSMIFSCICFGIILSVSKHIDQTTRVQEE
ncbi:MAG: FtsW/RodA/SpoVE family cell cycle protein [Saprospiraceae bacterium]